MFLNIVTDSSLSCPQSLWLPSSCMIKSKCLSLSVGVLQDHCWFITSPNSDVQEMPRSASALGVLILWKYLFYLILPMEYGGTLFWTCFLLEGRRSTGFSGSSAYKESACNTEDPGSIPGLGRPPGEGHGNPLQCFCLEHPHCQRSVVGYSPCGHKESDVTEWLNTHRLLQDRGRQTPQLWRRWDLAQHTLVFLL